MEGIIKEKLKELTDSELLELQYAIKHILEERGISEDVIKETIGKLYEKKGGSLRYTDITLYLEKAGFKREAIAKRVIEMGKKYPHFAHGGCPIGEVESEENPIYPTYEGVRYSHICYIEPRWEMI